MAQDRVFLIALGISGLLHLSMVTLFSIGIYFPREDHEYYAFEIVDSRMLGAGFSESPPGLVDLPAGGELAPGIADGPSFGNENDGHFAAPSLPPIELPRLEFADLDRLRLREMGADAESRYRRHSPSHPGDSWARFGQELERFGDTLARLPFLPERREGGEAPAAEVLTHPAPDFRARIEWLSEPKDRQLIFAPPIDALWGLEPAALQPMTFIIRVNSEGRVVEVISPAEGDPELVSQVGRQLLRYRFAPHNANQMETQLASYTLSGDPPRP